MRVLVLAASGRIGAEFAAALKAEASRRVAEHSFFGHMAYASVTPQKPNEARSAASAAVAAVEHHAAGIGDGRLPREKARLAPAGARPD